MTTVHVVIQRPVEEVFSYYIDPANRPLWSDHVLSGAWVTEQSVGVGAVFQITLRQWGRIMRTEREITEYVASEKVCYVMESNVVHVHSCQTFIPHETGTRFTIQAEMTPKGWFRLVYPFVAKNLADHLEEEAYNLKQALEHTKIESS